MISQSSCQSALCIVLLLAAQLLVLTSADDGQNVRLPARFGKRADGGDSAGSAAAANVPLLKMLMRGGSAEPQYVIGSNEQLYMLVPVKGGAGLNRMNLMHSTSTDEMPSWK